MKYRSSPSANLLGFIPLLLTVALLLTLSGTVVHFLTESWWFTSVNFEHVFWTRLKWRSGIWLGTFVLYAAFLWGNYLLAQRLTRDRPYRMIERSGHPGERLDLEPIARYGAIAVTLFLAFSAAMGSANAWETILKFLNPTAFDIVDPIYQQDVSFYIFQLPFYQGLQEALMGLCIWGMVLAIAIYALKGEIRPERGWKYFLTGEVKTHLCLLLVALAIVMAIGFWLERYNLLYSSTGIVFGAGYTDVHARLQAYWVMGFVTLAMAGLFVFSLWRSGFSLPLMGIVLYLAALILVNGIYPWFQQQFIVEPNELEKETPYIANNIQFTREAYHLEQVQTEEFPAETALDAQALQANQSTINNIRLWDYRPLLSTMQQIQEFRLYYHFGDVDIDRYTLNGNYRQVMLSARELSYEELPSEAKTWVNQRLKYTHGYGIVMSPVNRVTPNGLPELFIKNIPPESTVDLTLDQPRIYYGEDTRNYIFTGTSTDEFDYPLGDDNALFRYDGAGGVPIGSFWQRLAYAFDLGSLKILISNYFTPESRLHYYRQVQTRIRKVAPFLAFDNDPYIAVINGRLQWVIDAYTVSDRYPYAQPLNLSSNVEDILGDRSVAALAQAGVNYMRDSVKVVVDAYDGSMQFFVADSQDPILATYRKIFPNLFVPLDQLPSELRNHIRYPLDFFKVQAQLYRAYHMVNPDVFFSQEDLWSFPVQIYENEQVMMDPYYIIMRLPQEETDEFIQIIPFTPPRKDNMVAWLAGRSDGEEYGKLLVYEFPKQELVYGPSQIEARINQTPEISEQITLWNQQGSAVIRGDLLVIPIDTSLLYVEPVYLRAEQAELPELKRVIVAYGDQVVMRETLEQALMAIFGESAATPAETESAPDSSIAIPENLTELVQQAIAAYENSQEALRTGDWQGYGAAQQELGNILNRLNQTP